MELKPCPFCGSEAELTPALEIPSTLEDYVKKEKSVRCSKPKCALRFIVCGVSEWNRRSIGR